MDVIACVISLGFFLLTLFMEKKDKAINPSKVFFGLWTFILLLSILNLYNIIKPSNEAYLLIILMLIFFCLGNVISNIVKNKLSKEENVKSKKEIKPMFKLFYLLSFLIVLFNIIDIIIIIKQLIKGIPMWQIRNWTLEPYGSINPILGRRGFLEECIRSIILTPFATLIHPITAYYFMNLKEKKKKIKLLVNSLIVLITSTIAGGGGRLEFIYYIGCFLLAFAVRYKNNMFSKDEIKKYKKIIFIFLILGGGFVCAFTIFRVGIGNLIKQVYTYFALPPTLLSLWLPDIKNVNYTYGMTTFFGLHSYVFRIFGASGMDFLIPNIYNDVYTYILNAEIFKDVGYGVGNAFVTPIYYFFIDGGYIYVCLASLLFGYIVSMAYKEFEKKIDVRTFTIYVLIIYGIFLTFIRIQTAIPSYILSFIFAFIILRKQKQNEYENYKTDVVEYKKIKNPQDIISVVIPIYKVEKYLKKCIDSVLQQTYPKLEIILVDDGSPDNCGKICDEYAKKDKRIKVIHKENGGLSDARNAGIVNAIGNYITFIDSDDYIENNYIEILYNTLISYNADISIASHRVVYDKKIIEKGNNEIFGGNPKVILEKILYDQGVDLSAWGKLYKISLFNEIKFPKGRLYEDSATTYKLIDLSKKIAVNSKTVYNYIIRSDSISNNKFSEKKMDLITSTQEMTDFIRNKYPDLEKACDRRLMYAYLSTLTQLAMSNEEFPNAKIKMLNYINKNKLKVLKDKKVPIRDKVALLSIMGGYGTFKCIWNLYRKVTGRK